MSIEYEKSRVRILVTDDEDSIRSMLMATLKDDGWDVDGAINGKDAIEKIKQRPPHIVLSDINMPEVTGTELLEFVKANHPQTEFVIMTSHATLESALKAVQLGAYDYLNKPFEDISVVSKKMEQVAEKILLRQQNQELLKRLKLAGSELKRLLEAIGPLGLILDPKELREKTMAALPQLFEEQNMRAQWWVHQRDVWSCENQIGFDSNPEPLEDIERAQEAFGDDAKVKSLFFKKEDQATDFFIFENKKESLSRVFANQLELCFQKVQQHQEIASLANKDGLTRLYNHRYFQERLAQEASLARRQHSQVSVLLMDVDHFKNYNDKNGHPAGDRLLKKLASLLDRQVEEKDGGQKQTEAASAHIKRISDVVARYGGEEFVMLLPFTPYEGAKIKAERVIEAIRSETFEFSENQPLGLVSVSMGIATFPDHADNPAALVEVADRALYQAKEQGRNRFVGAEDLMQKAMLEEVTEEPIQAEQPVQAEPPLEAPPAESSSSEEVVSNAVPGEKVFDIETPPPPPEEVLEVEEEQSVSVTEEPASLAEEELPPPPVEVKVVAEEELPEPPPPEEVPAVEETVVSDSQVEEVQIQELPPPPVEAMESPAHLDVLVDEAVKEAQIDGNEVAPQKATLAAILDQAPEEEGESDKKKSGSEEKLESAQTSMQESSFGEFNIDDLVSAISDACDSANTEKSDAPALIESFEAPVRESEDVPAENEQMKEKESKDG